MAKGSPQIVDGERAPLRFRFGAMLYDAIIVLALWMVTIGLLVGVLQQAVVGAWVQSILFVELFAFFAYFWIHKGQTIGMVAWRLRLVSPVPFTLRKALLRFCGALASFLTLGLGYFWIWFDKDRRSWSDLASNSFIVRYKKTEESSQSPQEQGTDTQSDRDRSQNSE